MDVSALAAFPAVKKVIDLVRYLFEGDEHQWKPALLIVGSWVAGVAVAALVGGSSYAANLGLADLGLADLVLVGITLGSAAGVVTDLSTGGVTIK
jgi:hypothetical protein